MKQKLFTMKKLFDIKLSMNNKTLFFVMIIVIVGCDAHMQKGLEVYQERYTEPVTATRVDTTKFFIAEDDIDSVFSAADTKPRPKIKEAQDSILKTVTKAEVVSEGAIVRITLEGDGQLGMYKAVKNPEKNEIMFIVKNAETKGVPDTLDANSKKIKRVKFLRDKTQKHLVIILEFFTDVPLPDVKVQKAQTSFTIEF